MCLLESQGNGNQGQELLTNKVKKEKRKRIWAPSFARWRTGSSAHDENINEWKKEWDEDRPSHEGAVFSGL